MKKRLVTILISGLMASTMLAACGGSKTTSTSASASAASSSASAVSESSAEEVADTSETVADTSEETEAVADTSVASSSEASGDIKFVDGYYAVDENAENDFMILFYENAPGDVAYVNDGTNEAIAAYTVENRTTDDGKDFLLVTVGNLQLGYIPTEDGNAYLVDMSDGKAYSAAAVTEEEGDAIYQALQEAVNADVEESATDATDVQYVDGYYANDGNGNDFMIAFYTTSNGDFAYVNDGENEAIAEYTVSDATTDDGVAYTLVTVGETVLGYYTADNGDIYIVDEDGNTYVGGALTEEEADQLYDITVNQQ